MDRHKLWIKMEKYKRKCFIKKELKRIILKSIKINKNLPLSRRYLAAYYLVKLPRFSSLGFKNNRCQLTGRTWGVHSKSGLGRFTFRSQIYSSSLPGFRRASW